MKNLILIAAIASTLLIYCAGTETDSNNVPEAFENRKMSLSSFEYGRGYNVVEQLFREYLEAHPKLESKLEQFNSQREQILKNKEQLQKFKNNNEEYYSSATYIINSISDTVLSEKLNELLKTSHDNFSASMSDYHKINNQINSKDQNISDIIEAIKIVTTLKMTEDYQKNNYPSTDKLKKDLEQMKKIEKDLKQELKL